MVDARDVLKAHALDGLREVADDDGIGSDLHLREGDADFHRPQAPLLLDVARQV